MHFDVVSKTH